MVTSHICICRTTNSLKQSISTACTDCRNCKYSRIWTNQGCIIFHYLFELCILNKCMYFCIFLRGITNIHVEQVSIQWWVNSKNRVKSLFKFYVCILINMQDPLFFKFRVWYLWFDLYNRNLIYCFISLCILRDLEIGSVQTYNRKRPIRNSSILLYCLTFQICY